MKTHHEHVQHHLAHHDGFHMKKGGPTMHHHAPTAHHHEAVEAHLKHHDGGMHGHKHHHEEVKKLCGGGM